MWVHERPGMVVVRVSTPAGLAAAMLPGFKDGMNAQKFRLQLRKSTKERLNPGWFREGDHTQK